MLTWFKRNAAVTLTLVGLIGVATSSANADTYYDFTFSAPSYSNGAIQFVVSSSGIQTVTGTGTGSLAGGTVTSITIGGTVYGNAPAFYSTKSTPYFSTAASQNIVIKVGTKYYDFYQSGGLDRIRNSTDGTSWANGSDKSVTDTLTQVPLPVPGAGWLSWLLLGALALSRRGATLGAGLRARLVYAGQNALAQVGFIAHRNGLVPGGK